MTAGARVLADVATSSGPGAAPVVGAVVLVAVAVGVVVRLSRRR